MTKKLDVTGIRYGRLVGVERLKNEHNHSMWLWKCDCKTVKKIYLGNVASGITKSCGCINLERIKSHGMSSHWTYTTFSGIKSRCNTKSNKKYNDYGGRGIECEFTTYENFYQYVSNLPLFNIVKEKGLSINRIDNDGNYAVGNLEWSTQAEQELNKRISKNNTSGVEGVYFNKLRKRWYAYISYGRKTVSLGSSTVKEEAVAMREKGLQQKLSTHTPAAILS